MKKVILVVAMVFATSGLMNANTGDIDTKANKEFVMYDCGGFAGAAAKEYAEEGYDYWTVWFNAYGHCAGQH